MGWLSGILSGYGDRQHEIRQEEAQQDLLNQKQEAAVYNTLLNSQDPVQQHMGATGILQMGQGRKRKSGFAGWMGEMQSSPIYSTIQKYFQTPQTREETELVPQLRTRSTTGYLPMAPGVTPSMAQPETSPTEGDPMEAPQPFPAPPPPPPAQQGLGEIQDPTPPLGLQPPPAPPPPATSAFGPHAGGYQFPPGYEPPPPPPPEPIRTQAAPPPEQTMRDQVTPGPNEPLPMVARTRTVTGLPQMPTPSDKLAQDEAARVRGEIAGLQEAHRQTGDPDWQKKGVEEYLAQHRRNTPGLKEGDAQPVSGPLAAQLGVPEGTWMQPLYDQQTGNLIRWLPAASKTASSARAPNQTELIAHTLYAQPGENAKQTMERIQREGGGQLENVMRRQQAFVATRPLNAQERFADIGKLQDDWSAYVAPYQTLTQQILRMRSAWQAAMADPANKPVASEMIAVTFQKMLDPGSVVRESEARRSGSMQSYLGKFEGWIDQLSKGGANMTMDQLRPYLEQAEQILAQNEQIMAGERQRIIQRAADFQLGPLNLTGFQPAPPPPGAAGAPPPAPPPAATTSTAAAGGTTTPAPGTGGGRASIVKKPDGSVTIVVPD